MEFLRNKLDAVDAFKEFLADTRTEGDVEVVRSDGGEEFRGRFSQVCVDNRIKQEFTTPYTPQCNGVAEGGLALIETCQQAARIEAAALYPTGDLPKIDLWAEASSWACDAMNRTATSANPERKSPHEL